MADITLAECNEQIWLVGGEPLIDDLLANTLPPNTSVEVIQCTGMEEVQSMWTQLSGPQSPGNNPWLIHPAIARRTRNMTGDLAIYFGQWSAMIDDEATLVIRAAAARARVEHGWPVVLIEYRDESTPRAMADLCGLRAQLIEQRLVEEGVEEARISRITRSTNSVPGMAQESQRVDIMVRDPG